jgi:hypothetical protein
MIGIDWVRELERARRAVCVTGNGYPCTWVTTGAHVKRELASGPLGLHAPAPWGPRDKVDKAMLAGLGDDEIVLIEAWDRS